MSFPLKLSTLALALGATVTPLSALAAFSFGIMADTQWKADLDGENPDTVAAGIIRQLNQQFIAHQVKFVIQVGDLVDKETAGADAHRTLPTRAAAAQALYDAGICFFPLRGNHESSSVAANELPDLFPQTTGHGLTCGAIAFSSPFATLDGLSYSFDVDNARFVLLDQFTRKDGTNYLNSANYNIVDQQDWIEDRLTTKGVDKHGFVFSHKNLMGANHADMLFGANPAYFDSARTQSNADAQNAYFGSLSQNAVRYHFSGHDHNHLRSIVVSPDGQSSVQNIIASSNSYKFYVPKTPSLDEQYNLPAFGFYRETPIVQELFTVGYYLVTVDGPRVTVDHYASNNGCGGSLEAGGVDCDLTVTPTLSFEKRETFGYSLNGKAFLVAQGDSYTVVEDRFGKTQARILDGVNESIVTLYDGRATTKHVNTGWTPGKATIPKQVDNTASDVLTLWGLADLGTDQADTFTLSLSYEPAKAIPEHLGQGLFGLATRDADGRWINAVDKNFGGVKQFVKGPWKEGYELGTYGMDPSTKTAWAVMNYNGDFAVARFANAVE
jgi:hypothetical protein